MSEYAMPKHGDICWYELTTKDTAKAKDFYSNLLGWEYKQNEQVDMDYPEFQIDGKSRGGMMQMTEEWGDIPSHWMTYIAVDDVDITCQKVTEAGGEVCVPPTDIPVGRFSVIKDPSGATLSIIKLNAE